MTEPTHPSSFGLDLRDHEEFQRLTAPYQRELLVHCYRMLGSLQDAEDILQETWLKAWRRLDTFAGRGSLRAWLYKIATNAALDALEKQRIRVLPTTVLAPADPQQEYSQTIRLPDRPRRILEVLGLDSPRACLQTHLPIHQTG